MALHLTDNEIYSDRRVMIYRPNDWKAVDTDWVDVVILEDILGQFDFDLGHLQNWMVYLPTIQEHVFAGKLQVIITTRADILSEAEVTEGYKLESIKLFSNDLSVTLSSKQLQNSEKMSILNRQLQRHKKTMNGNEMEKCIATFSGLIDFPQCCLLFARDSNLFNRGSAFFNSPEKSFVDNISKLEPTRFLSLVFLFCNGGIREEYLSLEAMPESCKQLLMDLALQLRISEREASVSLLRDVYESFLGLYVVKSISHEVILGSFVPKPCFSFSHAVVCEAVVRVLWDCCPEIVVKFGDAEYLYQRTYTAETQDTTSQKTFIPLSLYEILAERMVYDVVKGLVKSVVKHSALKQDQFLMKLKNKLQNSDRVREFFSDEFEFHAHQDLTEGDCITFLQHLMQSDVDVVTSVYSQLLEFLVCTCKNISTGCWQCKEKQMLLELSLYYYHFEITDKLIAINACYTHTSLCNAARHGDLRRVQIVLESLKRRQIFNPLCDETKDALCRAYISGHQDVIEFLKEEITLDIRHVVDVVRQGDINALMKVTELLKCRNIWNPHFHKYCAHKDVFLQPSMYSRKAMLAPYSTALYIAYCKEQFDMASYLVQNGVSVLMAMLPNVLRYSSQQTVSILIKTLKDTGVWDSNCYDASVALQIAYSTHKYNVCDLLIQDEVLLTMENLPAVIMESKSFASVKKAIQHLKDTDSWDPKCEDASLALGFAYRDHKHDVCDFLIQEGVSLAMKNLPGLCEFQASVQSVRRAMQHLKDYDIWDPKCDDASKALENAYNRQEYDVCNLLVQEGVSLTMKNLPGLCKFQASVQTVKKAMHHLKDKDNWDPKCDDASKALENAYNQQNYDVCDLLVQEGFSLTMKNLPNIAYGFKVSFLSVMKAIQLLKDKDNWDPKNAYPTVALEIAYNRQMYDVCDLLIQEGVSLTMRELPGLCLFQASAQSVKRAIQHLKENNNWNPECDDASRALENAYNQQKYDVCDLLVQEGCSLTMKNLPGIISELKESLTSVKEALQQLKKTDIWDPKCDYASKALKIAYSRRMYYVCDLLVQEGVLLTMRNLHCVILRPLDDVKTAIQQLKDTASWDPKCAYASRALQYAFSKQKYDVCDLLIEEGVSLTMENLSQLCELEDSLQFIKRVIQHLKDTDIWDPSCDDASKALENAYYQENFNVSDLLVQEGVSLTMKNLNGVVLRPLDDVKMAVKLLKDTASWDPKCAFASRTLQYAYSKQKYDVCYLLIQEGVSLTMENLPGLCEYQASVQSIKKAIQHLKDIDNWDPKCDDASKALRNTYNRQNFDVCDILVQEGVSLTMKNLPGIMFGFDASFHSVKKAIQQLQETDHWDPKCGDASRSLQYAYSKQKYDVCDLLIKEGVSLTMKNLSDLCEFQSSYQFVKRAIQHLKEKQIWDPKCDEASKALENAYCLQNYIVCDLLVKEGISVTMKNLPDVILRPLHYVKQAVQQLKDTAHWDPKCVYASSALQNAYSKQKFDVCDFMVQEVVTLTMKNLAGICELQVSVQSVNKAIQHLKINGNWDPKCDDASKALENAYNQQIFHVCDLLVQEGVSLKIQNLPGVVFGSEASFQSAKKALQRLKDTCSWDPKCDEASELLANAYYRQKYDVCDLLVKEGVSLTMKNLSGVILRSLHYVRAMVQQLKDTASWDPKCAYASRALQYAFSKQKYDVCNLLIEEGVSLSMENLPGLCEFEESIQFVKKAIQHLKDTDNWDPKCNVASKALENAYYQENYDVCDLLVQEGVSLTMKNLHGVVLRPLDDVKSAVQQLKDTDNWDPRCADASRALQYALGRQEYELCDFLIHEGISLAMKNLPGLCKFNTSFQFVKKAIQQMKESSNWNPLCDDASKALKNAYKQHNYDVCDLLAEEGILLTMKNLRHVILRPLEYVKTAIQHLKDTASWDPKCAYASKALKNAYKQQNYDVCDFLAEEGILLTMKNLPDVILRPLVYVKAAVQQLKDTASWDPDCAYASRALQLAFSKQMNEVCDILIQEGIKLTMKNLPGLCAFQASVQSLKKAIQHLKDSGNWDPNCDDASKALENNYNRQKNDVCNLLVHEGVSLTMKNLTGVISGFEASFQSVKKAIQELKDTDRWDPKCEDAYKALKYAYYRQNNDVCDLLLQEGVSLNM
ncbi:hypothetical protein CHS0354_021938 [Potamilus streckersoni]|uniref:Novel STAND NTPase 3 domain-containing protein n=1 Tax=Potamilus streckersoni TaxID=2493646 RepID=A0AAE0VY86_9BIVA|nr:hypothetical protein CHS0354_021938 [Potamilus streckersoni]